MSVIDLVAVREARAELRALAETPEGRAAMRRLAGEIEDDPCILDRTQEVSMSTARVPITLRLDPPAIAALDLLAERLAADPVARITGYGGRITRQDAARLLVVRALEEAAARPDWLLPGRLAPPDAASVALTAQIKRGGLAADALAVTVAEAAEALAADALAVAVAEAAEAEAEAAHPRRRADDPPPESPDAARLRRLKELGWSVKGIAARCGLRSPSALGNVAAGRSRGLNGEASAALADLLTRAEAGEVET